MRRILALTALLAFMPSVHAQDKAKADISHNAEYRARYFWMQNPTGMKSSAGMAESRFKLATSFKANEKFGAHLTILHNMEFGQDNGETVGQHDDNTVNDNMLNVNEAFAHWMTADDMSFKVGRMNYQIADGYVIGFNDWEATPTSFEGVLGNYDVEFGKFQAFAFKYREISTTGTHPAAGSSASSDPEHNAYGINFDLKTTQEWFKSLNVHVIKDNQDALIGSASTGSVDDMDGQDVLRYGLHAGFNFGLVDLKAWYAGQTGEYKAVAAGGAVTSQDAEGTMMQAEVGFNVDAFMGSRFFILYHQDSGDEDTTTGGAGAYDPYFYERHANAGLMDIFGWGNLTYITAGWNGRFSDRTNFGLMYHMFSRTESGAGASGITSGGRYTLAPQDASKDKLGDELDLWAEHNYDGGLSTVLRLGYFMPGDVYDSGANPVDENIMEVMVEGKLTF